jgi:hypothetical protein
MATIAIPLEYIINTFTKAYGTRGFIKLQKIIRIRAQDFPTKIIAPQLFPQP